MTEAARLDPVAASGLFSANNDAIYQLDLEGRFTNANESLCALTGYEFDELVALDFRDVIDPDDLPRIEQHFADALLGERSRYQTRIIAKDGRSVAVDVTKFPVRDSSGTVTAVLGVARDLDPVREAMLATHRASTLLRIATRLSRLAGWSLEVGDSKFSWSAELYDLLDATSADGEPEELSRRLVDPGDLARLEAAIQASARTGDPVEQLVSARSLTGRNLVIQVIGEAVRDDDGAVIRIHGGFVDISSAVAEQEQRLRAEKRLRTTLDQLPDGIVFLDREWRLTFLNRAAVATSGVTLADAESHTVWDLFPEIEHNEVGDLYRAVMSGGEQQMIRSYTERFGIWLEVSAAPTDDGIAVLLRDVTGDQQRRDTIQNYTRELEWQAGLIEATSDAMIVATDAGVIESWNAGAEQLYGWTRAEAVGRDVRELVGDDIPPELRRSMRTRGRWSGELATRHRDGRALVVESRLQTLHDDDGGQRRVIRVDVDITEHFAARREARALEVRLQTTLNQIRDGVVFFDNEWRLTFVNDAGERFMQKPRPEMLGEVLWELYPGLEVTEFGVAYRRTMDDRVVTSARDFYPELDTWFDITCYPTEEGVMVYFQDVTEREAVRAELEEQGRRLGLQRRLLDAARDAMLVRDLDHVLTYWNRAAEDLYGWTADEVLGRSMVDAVYPDLAPYEAAHALVLRDGYWAGELRQVRRDGTPLIVDCRWQLIVDEDGTPTGVFAVNTDVTETRRRQEQSIRAQRMESLGTLAGGIAHDLNNVLTPILMSVQLLRTGETDANRLQLLDTIDVGVKRGADMIRQVLSFARGIDGERAVLRVEDLVDDLVTFCRDTLPKSVVADAQVAGELWPVVGDRTQLLQVLMNFVTNARDAMPEGGTITLRARNVELAEEYRAVTSLAPPGRYVAIDVEDHGIGMDAETMSKLFEPFFTTKPQGEGTGLGLPTSMAIARSHGGYIQVYSEPGNGSRFQLHVPASDDATLAVSPELPAVEMPRGTGERILVVDDEAAIRQIVRQTLTAHGYETVEASNGREAVDLIESGGEPIDLVLTDMMMPVMDGAETARYLVEHHPGIRVVAASGLNANGGVARVRELGISHFIAKPFTTDALLRTLREALDGH